MKFSIAAKPISVNDAFKGRHFNTAAKKQFDRLMDLILPKVKVAPAPYYRIAFDFHLVNFHLTDYDNLIKVIQDCLAKKGIITNDRLIVYSTIRKFPSKTDFIVVEVEGAALGTP